MRYLIRLIRLALIVGITWTQTLPGWAQQLPAEPAAQTPPADLEALKQSWAKLPPAEFARTADKVLKRNTQHAEIAPAVAEEAARRLCQTDAAAKQDCECLYHLLVLSRPALNDEKRAALREKLAVRNEPNRELKFPTLRDKYALFTEAGFPRSYAAGAVVEWLVGQDLDKLPADQLEWSALNLSHTPAFDQFYFTVRWTGTIRSPKSGDYTFSGNTLRIRGRIGPMRANSQMRVWIDDELVLDTATAETSQPVTLSADESSQLRVEFEHKHSSTRISWRRPAAAMLYWEGPDQKRQLVPASALVPPSREGSGLLGSYEYLPNTSSPLVKAERIDRQIDFLWNSGYTLLAPAHPEAQALVDRLIEKVAARYTSAEHLQAFAKGQPLFSDGARMAELMTSAQRQQVLQALTGNDSLLRELAPIQARDLYWTLRAGAEPEALAFLGRWMQVRDVSPRLTARYFNNNRRPFFELADAFTFEQQSAPAILEKEYLETPEGGCSLGTAYTLAYIYAFRNQIEDWIEKLDARLAKDSLKGDARAQWLLARAQAQEIRGNRSRRYVMLPERTDGGWSYLDEAALAATTEPMRLRIYREKLARRAGADQREAVAELLAEAKKRLPSPESQKALASWQQELDAVAKRFDGEQVSYAEQGQAAHATELKRRLQKAEAAKDEAAIARYRALVEAAAPKPAK